MSVFNHRGSLHHLFKVGQQVAGSHEPVCNLHSSPSARPPAAPVLLLSHVDGLVLLQLCLCAKGVAAAATAVEQNTGPGARAQVNLRADGPGCAHLLPGRGEGELAEEALILAVLGG